MASLRPAQSDGDNLCVVYFDQQTGAPHAVSWSKSFFDANTTFSANFYDKMLKNGKK